MLTVHSQGGAPGRRGLQQTQSSSLCWRPSWAGSAGTLSSILGEEHAGKLQDPLQLWSKSSPLTSWRYLRNNTADKFPTDSQKWLFNTNH